MAWVRLDDHFPEHPKWLSLSPFWRVLGNHLHANALCWCNRHLTDGAIPKPAVGRLMPEISAFSELVPRELRVEDVAGELVAAGIWEEDEDHYYIHDYLDYQPSRASMNDRREAISTARRQAGSKGGSKRQANGKQTASNAEANEQQTRSKDTGKTQAPIPIPIPIPNRRSSSADAPEDLRAREPLQPIINGRELRRHGSTHSFCGTGLLLCIPHFLFEEFMASCGQPEAERRAYVRAWAERVDAEWTGKAVGDQLQFWRERWRESHVTPKARAAPAEDTAALVLRELQRTEER